MMSAVPAHTSTKVAISRPHFAIVMPLSFSTSVLIRPSFAPIKEATSFVVVIAEVDLSEQPLLIFKPMWNMQPLPATSVDSTL
ncbi:hypothetical protein ACFX13_019284 [Malus domestica]